MRFSCTQENLNQGLNAVSHVASKNVNLPVLNNLLVKAEGGLINFFATNLEIGISCDLRGVVEEDGVFTVPARVFNDYVNLLPTEKVDLNLKEEQLEIKCGKHQTKIKGEPASEFPLIPQVEKKAPFTVNAGVFIKGLQQVVFATALSESRPEISGVLLDFKKNGLLLAATDSYRLAEKKISWEKAEGEEKKVIVPAATLQEVQRVLSNTGKQDVDDGQNLDIYLSDNQILFVYKNIELVSRVIEGQYPDYKAIFPGSFKTQVIINTNDLVKAVKSASLFVKSGINDVSLDFSPEGEIVVSSVNSQVGENTSSLEANISGDRNQVVLNYRYLLDGLQAVNTSEVVIEIVDNNTPIVLKPVLASADEGIDRNYLYLIMPIKQ